MGRSIWKKKWVYCDSEKLLQWQTEKEPTDTSLAPRHGFALHRCNIEECDARSNAFKITDTYTHDVIVLATDTVAEWEIWIEMLSRQHTDPALRLDVDENGYFGSGLKLLSDDDHTVSQYSEMAPLDADIILEYFHEFDATDNVENPVIDEKKLKALITQLDPTINSNATNFVLRDLNIKKGSFNF